MGQPVQGPDGKTYDFPDGTTKAQAITYFKRKNIGMAVPRMPEVKVPMQESPWPGIVKGAASALPVVGGVGGALAGAPAFGAGGMVGAGLGAAGGEAARQALMRNIFDEGPSPITKEGLKRIGITGAASAAAEVPGALASSLGNRVITRIAEAKSPREVGNVIEALKAETPAGFSMKGFQRDLMMASKRLSVQLRQALRGSNATVDLDAMLANVKTEAQVANLTVPGTLKRFERTIAAAKINSGIKGNQATADQLFEFQKQIGKPGYAGAPGPAAEVTSNLLKSAYRRAGQQLRVFSPQVDPILGQMTNLHAAQNAIKVYKPGTAASLAATAALHPRATAAVSPLVGGAAAVGGVKAKKLLRDVVGVGVQ